MSPKFKARTLLYVEWRTGDIKISLRMFVEAPIRQINRSFWPLPLLVSIPTHAETFQRDELLQGF